MSCEMRSRAIQFLVLFVGIACAAIFAAGDVLAESTGVTAGLRSVNDTELYCRSQGAGEAIVVLHGGPGVPHDYFLPHLEGLADDHQVIYFDQRATGRSSGDVDPATLTMDTFVADLETLRESYGLDSMHLLGHSWGGLLAMQYALRHPDSVASLILVDSAPASSALDEQGAAERQRRLTDEDLKAMAAIRQTEEFAGGDPAAIMEFLGISERVKFHDPERMAELRMELDRETLGKLMMVSGAMRGYLADYDIHDRLGAIECPTLIIHGQADPIPLEASERIHAEIAGSKLVVMERCGHFPFIEDREGFVDVVNRFLGQ